MKTPAMVSLCAAVTAAFIGVTQALVADVPLAEEVSIPATLTGQIEMTECSNRGGPVITLSGEIALGGLQANVILKNNVRGTHTTVVEWEGAATLLETGETIEIPKQPSRGGVGGNPHVWIQLLPENGDPTEPVYIGRCVQGFNLSLAGLADAWALLDVGVGGCNNNPGPWIYLGGDIILSGLDARFIFTNNARGTHTAEETVVVNLISAGTVIAVPKQPVQGGAAGNPLVYIQLLNDDGDAVGDEIFIGRCNQI